MRVLICEDDVTTTRHLKLIIKSFGFCVAGIARTIKEGIELVDSTCPDIVLIDIKIQGKWDGIEIAKHINKTHAIPFIFITNNDDPLTAQKALDLKPSGYIIKPYKSIEIYSSIRIANNLVPQKEHGPYIFIKEGNQKSKLYLSQILWIQSDNIFVQIHTLTKSYKIRQSLKKLKSELPPSEFIQCHRSFIINKKKISRITSQHIHIDENIIPIARTYQEIINCLI